MTFKLDAIARFEMCNSLELTHENPIGLVNGKCSSGKSTFIREICKTEIAPNIIYFDGKEVEAWLIVGPRVVYKTIRTKEVFNKVDEICRFSQATGLKVPTLVIFEEFDMKDLKNLHVQNDLSCLFSKCQAYDLRILFVQQEISEDQELVLRGMTASRGIGFSQYQIVLENEKRFFARIHEKSLNLTRNMSAIWCTTEEILHTVNLLCDGKRYLGKWGIIINLLQMRLVLEDLRHPTEIPKYKLYLIELDSKIADSMELESLIREGSREGIRFILVGDYIPAHLDVYLHQLEDVVYEGSVDEDHTPRVCSQMVVLDDVHPHIMVSEDELPCITIEVDGELFEGPEWVDAHNIHDISNQIKCRKEGLACHGGRDLLENRVFFIRDKHVLDLPILERCIQLGCAVKCHFVVIGDKIPDNLSDLVIKIGDIIH